MLRGVGGGRRKPPAYPIRHSFRHEVFVFPLKKVVDVVLSGAILVTAVQHTLGQVVESESEHSVRFSADRPAVRHELSHLVPREHQRTVLVPRCRYLRGLP